MKKAQSFKDVKIEKKEDKIVDMDSTNLKLYTDELVGNICYTTFLLFYAYLRAKKLGNTRKNGWMYNKLRITQHGEDYTFTYDSEEYEITRTSCIDISDIILKFIP